MAQKHKKKRSKSIDGKLIFLRERFTHPTKYGAAVSELKRNYGDTDLPYYVRMLGTRPQHRNVLSGGTPFPRTWQNVKRNRLYCQTTTDREILWNACILNLFQEELRGFISFRMRYEDAVVSADYKTASGLLDTIESQFGCSLWLLENKINLLQMVQGLESQKAFSKPLQSSSEISGAVRFLAYTYSYRAEPNVSYQKYKELIDDFTPEETPWNLYIRYRANTFWSWGGQDPCSALYFEGNGSIIDRYQTWCHMALSLYACEQQLPALRDSLLIMKGVLDDPHLSTLTYLLGLSPEPTSFQQLDRFLALLEYYTKGMYDAVVNLYREQPLPAIFIVEATEIAAKSFIRMGHPQTGEITGDIPRLLLHGLSHVLLKTTRGTEAFNSLAKLSSQHQSHRWAAVLLALLLREYRYLSHSEPNPYLRYGELSAILGNPRLALAITDDTIASSYLDAIQVQYGRTCTGTLLTARRFGSPQLLKCVQPHATIDSRVLKYTAEIYLKKNQYTEAAELYAILLKEQDPLFRQDAIDGMIQAHLGTGNVAACIEIISNELIENVYKYPRLPIAEVLDNIEILPYDSDIRGNIGLPIVYDVYSKYIAQDREIPKFEAYETFVELQGCKRPSELADHRDAIPIPALIYFLRYVCVPNTLDSSIAFESTEDVLNERITLCQLLCELDPSNNAIYNEEIKNITERLVLQKSLRMLDQSKIYVDVQGIKNALGEAFRESYNRYIALRNTSLSGGELLDKVVPVQVAEVKETGIEYFDLPGNESFVLLKNMFLQLRDKFVGSSEYGLDGYLSVGIRHGTLSGQLRGPLELAGLITEKDSKAGRYKRNDFWRSEYEGLPEEVAREMDDAFSTFSARVDSLIDKLRKQWLQIKTESKHPDGLFDFQVPLVLLQAVSLQIHPTMPYEQFINYIIEIFWGMTDVSLERIREKIQRTLRTEFNEAFDQLHRSIAKHIFALNLSRLNSNIAGARTAINNELDKIAAWFQRENTATIDDYDITLGITIATTYIYNVYPKIKFNPKITVENGFPKLRGGSLKAFVAIMYILFDNIVKHAGVEGNDPFIMGTIKKDGSNIQLGLINEVAESVDVEKMNLRMEEIKDGIRRLTFFDRVSHEGGSGLHKVKKIVSVDLGCASAWMDFGYEKMGEGGNVFVFSLVMESKGVVA